MAVPRGSEFLTALVTGKLLAGRLREWRRLEDAETNGQGREALPMDPVGHDPESRRGQIVGKIAVGLLPRSGLKQTKAGRGRSRACSGCDQPIIPRDMEIESVLADGQTLFLHLECFAVWWNVVQTRHGTLEI